MKKRTPIITFFLLLIATAAMAHPHIFLTNTIETVFNKDGIEGFKISWLADDFSSTGLTEGYDENENGIIDPYELTLFETDSVENLKQYQYFTHLKIDKKQVHTNVIKQFKARFINGKIEYSFFIPCAVKATKTAKNITIAQYDSTYFSFISFSTSNPTPLKNNRLFNTQVTIAENKKNTYYFGTIHPFEMTLRFSAK